MRGLNSKSRTMGVFRFVMYRITAANRVKCTQETKKKKVLFTVFLIRCFELLISN